MLIIETGLILPCQCKNRLYAFHIISTEWPVFEEQDRYAANDPLKSSEGRSRHQPDGSILWSARRRRPDHLRRYPDQSPGPGLCLDARYLFTRTDPGWKESNGCRA